MAGDQMKELRAQLDMTHRLLRAAADTVMAQRRRERELAAAVAEERGTATTRRVGG